MAIDTNDYGEQMSMDAIPAGTKVKLGFTVKGGGQGEDGSLTRSKSGHLMLALECTVISQPYYGRKVFEYWLLEAAEGSADGIKQAVDISRRRVRAAINSHRNIAPDADDPNSRAGRVINGYGDFHGLTAAATLSVEAGDDNNRDQNKIAQIIEPGDDHYQEVMQGHTIAKRGGNAARAQAAGGWTPPVSQQPQQPTQQPQQPTQQTAQQPMQFQPQHQPAQQPAAPQQPAQQSWTPPAQNGPAPTAGAPDWAKPQGS